VVFSAYKFQSLLPLEACGVYVLRTEAGRFKSIAFLYVEGVYVNILC